MPEILTTEITATQYFSTVKYAKCLMIDDQVLLVRVPDHAKDPNAIRVELDTGEQLGFIERKLAAKIAPEIDKLRAPLPAYVSGLEGGKFATEPRIRISFTLDQAENSSPKIEYLADCSGHYSYVLLNAAEPLFKDVIENLQKTGYICHKTGISHKPSIDGRQYQWYINVKKPDTAAGKPINASEEEIDSFFKTRYNICSSAGKLRDLQKALEQGQQQLNDIQTRLNESEAGLEIAAKEIETRKTEAGCAVDQALEYEQKTEKLKKEYEIKEREAAVLREQRDNARQNVILLERQEERFKDLRQPGRKTAKNSDLAKIIASICPNIRFLRDSLDELTCLPDPSLALKLIGTLACNPESLKGERFEGTEFKELRFSNGQSNVGRMYFRQVNKYTEVLVSNKKEQCKGDGEYLGKR